MSYTSKYLEELRKLRGVTDDYEAGDDYTREYLKVLNEIAPLPVQQTPLEQSTPKTSQKPEKKEEKVDFFKKGGLFKDGYDFGDVWRTAGLTFSDAALTILEGIGGMAEGVLDLGGHIVAGGADLLGADKFADGVRKAANHNTVSEAAEWIRDIGGEGGIGEGSVLGRTTRGVGQGVGQIGGILLTGGLGSAAGLGAAGTTALTTGTMFASSAGAGVSEAYNDGASDAEAYAYGAIKGGVDAVSELIFGGLGKGVKALGISHGLSSADDILAKKLSSKISSKLAKTLVQAGVKAGAEGLEEVAAGLGTAAAKLIYKDGVSYQQLVEDENLLEQFVVGALSSGIAQSGGVVNSVKTGTDFISGMAANEEAVVNKEVEKRIAQEEESGNKLTNKEKNAIYDAVVKDMDKGYISTETIEEALGGDTFKAYQDAIESEKAIKQEYEKLANTPKGELTHIQEKRLAELEAQIEAEPKSKALKQQLQDATFNLAKDSRLVETYNEQGRRKQAFKADLTQYDTKQAEIVKKAVESGILNNTNRTHEFVDLVAKISADKGVSFDFANNAKIKESGFAVDGATVNGFVTDSGITVNIQSSKALNTVVGHEITHILEGTELYDGLQKAVVEYAKTKGEYDSRLAAITKLYEGRNADVNKELTADLVGDYLFTDSDFIARLSVENRNVFQRIYDEIKYLAKVATAGSKEARQLEKAKRAFEKVYKESKGEGKKADTKTEGKAEKNTTEKGDVKYDIVALDDGKVYVEASRNVINGTTLDAQRKDITEFFNVLLDGNQSLEIHTIEGDVLTITKGETADKARDNYKIENGQRIKLSDDEFAVKLRVEAHIDEVAEVSTKIGQDSDKKNHSFAKDGFTYRRAYFKDFDGQYYEITLSIGHNGTVATVYNVGKIKGSVSPSAKIIAAVRSKPLGETTSNKKVPQKEGNVKYSISTDTEGNKLTKGQQEYFKDSKVVDENGNLKVMYHGTQNGGFHEFSNDYTDDGISFFFTDRNDVAASYSSSYETYAAKAFKTAQDANNFFAEIGKPEYEVIEKDGEYTLYDDGDEVVTSDSLAEIYDEFRDWEGVGYGDVNYKVYLNLTNPLVVDAKGEQWNELGQWSKAAYIKAENVEVKRVGDEFRLYDKNGTEIKDAAITINEHNKNIDQDTLRRIMVDKVNSILSISTENLRSTRDVAKWAKKNGYDGVIFNNLVDSGGFSNGSEGTSTVAIAFESNQIKSTANTNPTVDTDIRFSLSETVEETNDLMAIHNLTTEKLLKSLQLGGLPMPSIAVAKGADGHTTFGDISLIFPKETIDPKGNRANKVYSGDAWTPTYPTIEYKASRAAVNAIEAKIDGLVPYAIQRDLGGIDLDEDNLNNALRRYDGDLVKAYQNSYAMQYAFLVDNGFSEKLPMTEKNLDGTGRYNNGIILDAVRELGTDEIERLANEGIANNEIAKLMDIVNGSIAADIAKEYPGDGKVAKALSIARLYNEKTFGFAQADSLIRAAFKYTRKGIEQHVEYSAATELIKKTVDEESYKKWLNNLFTNVVEKEGIRNNRDPYTPSGSRRSFEALHYEHTLENVVKAMKESGEKGIGAFGGGNIFGASTTEFGSIKEMKEASDRLQKLSDDDFSAIKQEFIDRFYDLAHSLPKDKSSFLASDDAANMLVEAVTKFKTRSGMANYLRNESKGWANYSDQVVDDLMALVQDIHSMPTRYFEAKPQRAVGFDEVAVFVIPRNADVKLKQELLSRGYSIAEYDPDVEGDRQKVVNQFEDYKFSLSPEGATQQQYGNYNVYGKDIALETEKDIAPVREDIQPKAQTKAEMFPDDYAPLSEEEAAAMNEETLWSLTDDDAPVETEPVTDSFPSEVADPLSDRDWADVGNRKVKAYMYENPEVKPYFQAEAKIMQTELRDTIKGERIYWEDRDGNYGWTGTSRWTSDSIAELRDNGLSYADIEKGLKAIIEDNGAENTAAAKRIELVINDRLMYGYKDFSMGLDIPPNTKYVNLLKEIQSTEANAGSFDSLMEVADDIAPPAQDDIAPVKETVTEPAAETVAEETTEEDNRTIFTVQQRLEAKLENAEKALAELEKKQRGYKESLDSEIESIGQQLLNKKNTNTKVAQDLMKRIIRKEEMRDNINADYEKRIADQKVKIAKLKEEVKAGESPTEQAAMRAELHENMIDNIKSAFAEKGFDFDDVLKKAKDLSTFSTVDNTPQRVLEKSLGYKEGQILADMTVNKVAENETKAIRWLNSITDRKNGLLAQLSKQYKIKPGSKESAAAQMYAEGFYVNENDEIIRYSDAELMKDFPDAEVRKNIKGLARDPRIREFYDSALAAINESRARNAYPEIKKLDNYFLHFRAMDDTFSRLGIPFNPNDIKAKDLPTDLNGVTADLKPGQPYFASSMHRKGKRTSFDLLGGIEQYATGASRQIFHIDDIQILRALRNYVADTFGQAKGLEDLDLLTEEEAEAKIKEVYGAHLSTFAKFLNEEANVIAGKTALTDRGLEGIIGRRGITFLDSLNKQVGANMIGFNISSSLTNLIAPVQAFAKSNKAAFVKAMAQTAYNRLKSIKGQSDGFMEQSPVAIRRQGADRFARTPWQKVSDAGYVFMSAVDGVSTEIIARAKYNELTRKGMDSKQAHIETDKWVSRLMGDRSLGQQPQIYNSKMLGMFTKFQLEVRNQLDAQFYDTIQEAKLSNEEIKNKLERNAKTAAKVTKTFVELAVLQHLFGKAFESVAGYNPAFDIISALIKAFGFDDDEDDDDTFTDNLWEGAQELLGDLPYTSTFTGGRIPISSALPIEQFVTGKDSYGNDKSRWETLGEAAPYYLMPGGYGQIKKTTQGLSMFDDDLPIAGSYTDSGNLRFPVAPTVGNVAQAALFGQYASQNARDYFDNEYAPLKEKQIQEFIDLDIPIKEYREIREELADKDTLGEKVAYIATLDLPIAKKNILVNNAANREEPIDMTSYGEYDDWGEFEYAHKYPEKYAFLQANGISAKQYKSFDDETKEAWSWAYQDPEKFALSKSIASDVVQYREYTKALADISADKDENGKSISGSRKEKVIRYINSLDADYGEKIILLKSEYPSDDTYNNEIVEYLNNREDITYEEMITILTELGFTVKNGRAYWD